MQKYLLEGDVEKRSHADQKGTISRTLLRNMHRFLYLLFVFFVFANLFVSSTRAEINATGLSQRDFKIEASQDDTFSLGDGRFEISGRKPKGFTDFRYLYLEGALLKAAPGRRLLPQPPGTVRGELHGKQKFKLRNARFEGEYLTFETAVIRGVGYKFEGKVSNFYPDDSSVIAPQFKGTLTKMVNAKKTASAEVAFVWIEPEF